MATKKVSVYKGAIRKRTSIGSSPLSRPKNKNKRAQFKSIVDKEDNMKTIILSVLGLGLLSACSAGMNHAGQNDGGYVWVGCHVIHTNPVDCYPAPDKCAFAFGPEGDKVKGQKIYWKQVDKYGKVGRPMTARPCREGE